MTFDLASDATRAAVAREAGRALPAPIAFKGCITPEFAAYWRELIGRGWYTDYPPDRPSNDLEAA